MIYHLARGPLVWVAVAVFLAGVVYRAVELFRLTRRRERRAWPTRNVRVDSPAEAKLRPILSFQHSLLGQHPVMAVASGVFHLSLFAAPLFAKGHNLLLREAWGGALWSLPLAATDALTIVVLAGVLFLLARRLAVPRVRAVTGAADFVLLALVAVPYLTGFMAYHQLLPYRPLITAHMLAGELMLMAIPFTKLAHLIFFFFARGFLQSEHNVAGGDRVWSA